jgi:D-alanyl-D-alanine dipeptidase
MTILLPVKRNPAGWVILFLSLASYSCFGQNTVSKRNPYNLKLIVSIDAYRQQVANEPQMLMVDLEKSVEGIITDIRYATKNNFTGTVIYTGPKAYARKPVADALRKVQDSLAFYHIGLKIYDAYRPYAATLKFYEVYPDTNFVADPRYGSNHNRGCAVDVSLVELSTGRELPMPTPFDDFTNKAGMAYTNLPDTVLKNRRLLSGVMTHFGFEQYAYEWWHFDYRERKKYSLMDLSFGELEKAIQQENQK